MLTPVFLRTLALFALLTPGLASIQDQATGDELSTWLETARQKLHATQSTPTIQLSGTTTRHGLPAQFRWTLAPRGNFLRELRGPFPAKLGYDGQIAWEVEGRAPSRELSLLARERLLTETWVLSGAWCLADGPFTLQLADAPQGETRTLDLRLTDGLIEAQLVVDTARCLPRSLIFAPDFGGGGLRFSEWNIEGPLPLPHKLIQQPSQEEAIVFDVRSAGPWTRTPPDWSRPLAVAADTEFDAEASSRLEVRQVESGHIFVRPRVDGRDLGWFLFDSGLGGSILTRAAAEDLGLQAFGETWVGGFGGPPERSQFLQGHKLTLGPLSLDGPVFIEQEHMGMADRMLGDERCVGALGWDLFLRAVVELDPRTGRVDLHDPQRHEAPSETTWLPIALHWQVPYVRARFAQEHEGWFGLDTGAGDLTALFHHSAASRLGWLETLDGKATPSQGARGGFQRHEHELAWFEIAGERHAPARVQLSVAPDGEADPYTMGFMGSGFLGKCPLVFDYARSRVGLLPERE
jgi:hypothetical protein